MKMNDYVCYMNKIMPTEEMDMRMAEVLSAKNEELNVGRQAKPEIKNRNRSIKRITLKRMAWKLSGVFVALLLFFIPVNVFADEIRNFYEGLFMKESDSVKQLVNEDVFMDEDEHVRIEVKEAVTDSRLLVAVIKYEALDDYGIKWLDEEENKALSLAGQDEMTPEERYEMRVREQLEFFEYDLFRLLVNSENDSIHFEASALDEYRTETERYFLTFNDGALDSKTGIQGKPKLYYKLSSGKRSTELDIKAAEEYSYALNGPSLMNGEINPSILEISGLHYDMMAEYVKPEEDSEERRAASSVVFYMKDGSVLDCGESDAGTLAGVGVQGEALLASKSFFNWFKMHGLREWYGNKMDISKWFQNVDPAGIVGVAIDGVYYEAQLMEE